MSLHRWIRCDTLIIIRYYASSKAYSIKLKKTQEKMMAKFLKYNLLVEEKTNGV